MDETQIAAQLAQKIPSDKPEPVATPPQDSPPEPSAFETSVELNDPAIGLQLADFFGVGRVDRFSDERQQQLRNLYRWGAEKAGTPDKVAVMDKLRVLEMELGVAFKPDRLNTLARWVKLDKQADTIRREKDFMRNGI